MSAPERIRKPTAAKLKSNSGSEHELRGKLAALDRVQAIIEFSPDGTIIAANQNFLATLGYDLSEIQGKHHKMFCDPAYVESLDYRRFWDKLNRGEFDSGEYLRIGKGGKRVWINASYNPVLDDHGKIIRVVKFATDITKQKLEAAEFSGKMAAVSKAQAIIEFNLDGSVITANENFLKTLGYDLTEIKGKHHRMFCDATYTNTSEYRAFWEKLNRGEFDTGEYMRLGKGGKEVWIHASYNPIFDLEGKPYKVVKFAADITAEKGRALEADAKLSAIGKVQAVIEFSLDGNVTMANENFLKTLGYDLSEIKGKHHRMFCESSYTSSQDYRAFWEKLNRGEFDQGEYKRVGKGGKQVWINASYNPIFGTNGKPYKVVKYATDITAVKTMIASIEETAATVASAASEMTATATQMQGSAAKTDKDATHASATAAEVSKGVETVAASTEEMAASIKEIARSANESSQMAKSTLQRAQETNRTITQLGTSSQEIGDVIKVISSIAQQTNLLALNATIEAARAGDAGKGFAVVANEVKELAKQTAKATQDITNRIGAIQKDTQGAVDAIAGISQAVEKLNGISGAIAAAVEEQNATTTEVSRVVTQSKKGVESIAASIKSVSLGAAENTAAASQTLSASKSLAQLSEQLTSLVKKVQT